MPYNFDMAIQWSRRRYTEEQFRDAVASSDSFREVVRKLGQNPDAGGIYLTIRSTIEQLGLDTSHMSGQGWNKGNKSGHLRAFDRRPDEEIFVENSDYLNTHTLKNRLWKDGHKKRECERCGLTEWMGESAPLALDHINGNRFDNRLDNLRILCYNCHGQTETYCGKNIGKTLGHVSQRQRK